MQRSVIKKYGIYSTFLFVVIFLSVLSVMLILTVILFPIGMILFEIGLFEQIFQYYAFTIEPFSKTFMNEKGECI